MDLTYYCASFLPASCILKVPVSYWSISQNYAIHSKKHKHQHSLCGLLIRKFEESLWSNTSILSGFQFDLIGHYGLPYQFCLLGMDTKSMCLKIDFVNKKYFIVDKCMNLHIKCFFNKTAPVFNISLRHPQMTMRY